MKPGIVWVVEKQRKQGDWLPHTMHTSKSKAAAGARYDREWDMVVRVVEYRRVRIEAGESE